MSMKDATDLAALSVAGPCTSSPGQNPCCPSPEPLRHLLVFELGEKVWVMLGLLTSPAPAAAGPGVVRGMIVSEHEVIGRSSGGHKERAQAAAAAAELLLPQHPNRCTCAPHTCCLPKLTAGTPLARNGRCSRPRCTWRPASAEEETRPVRSSARSRLGAGWRERRGLARWPVLPGPDWAGCVRGTATQQRKSAKYAERQQ